jgi:hypothetical protein
VAHVGAPVGVDGSGIFSVAAELGAWRWKSRLFVRPSITIIATLGSRDHARKI